VPDKFTTQGALVGTVRAQAALKAVVVTLFKTANDLSSFGSGLRTGLQQLILPASDSSSMPGKVNPAQAGLNGSTRWATPGPIRRGVPSDSACKSNDPFRTSPVT
jgi:lyase family enzyme